MLRRTWSQWSSSRPHDVTAPRAFLGRNLVLALSMATSLSLTASALENDDETKGLAEALVRLRGDVEGLSDDINALDAAARARQLNAATRHADAEVEKARAIHRLERLRAEASRERLARDASTDAEKTLVPAVNAALRAIDEEIRTGVPFRVEERRAAVKEIQQGLDEGRLRPAMALLRAWSLIQDEERLTHENTLSRQTVVIDGDVVMADVARVGMVFLYFRLPDGRVGTFVRHDTGFSPVVESDRDRAQGIRALFDGLAKQIRTGPFDLPASVPGVSP